MSSPYISIVEDVPHLVEVLGIIQQSTQPMPYLDIANKLRSVPGDEIRFALRYAANKNMSVTRHIIDKRRSAHVIGYGPITGRGERFLAVVAKMRDAE